MNKPSNMYKRKGNFSKIISIAKFPSTFKFIRMLKFEFNNIMKMSIDEKNILLNTKYSCSDFLKNLSHANFNGIRMWYF